MNAKASVFTTIVASALTLLLAACDDKVDHFNTRKQPLHQYTFPIDTGDVRYYSQISTDAGLLSNGPSARIEQTDGALHIVTKTEAGSASYAGYWHSVRELARHRDLLLDPGAALPWPISSSQFRLVSWYAAVKGQGNWKAELKVGPQNDETLLKKWEFNGFKSEDYREVERAIPAETPPFKLLNLVAETDSDLYFDEVGFYVKVPPMSDLRYAFLVSAAQVFRCYGREPNSGTWLCRDRAYWPLGDFDSVPGLGFSALVAAVAQQLGYVSTDDARTLTTDAVDSLLALPSHPSGFYPHWTKVIEGKVIAHPDSEISTIDSGLGLMSAYYACSILDLQNERLSVLQKIRTLDFASVTVNGEISMGFGKDGQIIPSTWRPWGGETLLMLVLARLNNLANHFSSETAPPPPPAPAVDHGTGFIMEIAPLLFGKFGGRNIGPDRYGVDWYVTRQRVLSDQAAALGLPNFSGVSAVEIVSEAGLTRYHVGWTQPVHTGEDGYGFPWVAPHIELLTAALDPAQASACVKFMGERGLMPPLGGPAESALINPADESVVRWHSMQGVLNGTLSALGAYHAVVAAEGLPDRIYDINDTDADLKLATDSLFLGPPASATLQAEAGTGNGSSMPRGNAQGLQTVWLHAGESRSMRFPLPTSAHATVAVRYSNDNFGDTEQVDVVVDAVTIGSFSAQDSGDYGQGWNVFVQSSVLGPVPLGPGEHTVSVTVRSGTGDGYGIEIDAVTVDFAD